MLQAHYVMEGYHASLAKVVSELEKKWLVKQKEDIFRFKHTYYDSGNKTLLKNGGYCRKNIRFDLDKTVPPNVIIEYRPHKKSHTKRYVSEQEMSLEELSKVLGFNYHFKKIVRFKGYQLAISFRMKGDKEDYLPHLDFVVQFGEIINLKTKRVRKVSIVSLVDTTAAEYNVGIANHLSYKTERIISSFEKMLSEMGYEKLTSNRYGEILSRMPNEDVAESIGSSPIAEGQNVEDCLDVSREIFNRLQEKDCY